MVHQANRLQVGALTNTVFILGSKGGAIYCLMAPLPYAGLFEN